VERQAIVLVGGSVRNEPCLVEAWGPQLENTSAACRSGIVILVTETSWSVTVLLEWGIQRAGRAMSHCWSMLPTPKLEALFQETALDLLLFYMVVGITIASSQILYFFFIHLVPCCPVENSNNARGAGKCATGEQFHGCFLCAILV